jgi:hypothetical protein
MKKTILTLAGSALIAASAMQMAAAAQPHRSHRADRASNSAIRTQRGRPLNRTGRATAAAVSRRQPDADHSIRFNQWPAAFGGRPLSFGNESLGLPGCNECCSNATSEEHLVDNPAGPCMRRYLATPLHEIIPS